MNPALIASLLFLFSMPLQVKNPSACDHAAPPAGMQWVCPHPNACDCHLQAIAPEDQNANSLPGAVSCLACRIAFFVIPPYPEAARREQKQGLVSASLVVRSDGSVQEVRIQSGDPQLAHAVQSAFEQWRLTPGNRVESIPVSVNFELSENPSRVVAGTSLLNTVVTAPPLH